jgi:hypothetical protein
VKGVVAVLKDKPELTFYLAPFEPTPDEVAKVLTSGMNGLLQRGSPDIKKWPSGPLASFSLSWSEGKAAGDAKQATVYIHNYGLGPHGMLDMNMNKTGTSIDLSLTGPVKVGQVVTLTSKGSETILDTTLSWNLTVKAKVLAAKPN